MEIQHNLFDQSGQPNTLDDPIQSPRLTRQQAAVLARLQQGPATNVELMPLSMRYSARIFELRKAGWIIETDYIDKAAGICQYAFKGKRK